jgi:hypothetical protein
MTHSIVLENEANIDHVITRAPNCQLSAGRCKLNWDTDPGAAVWDKDLVLLIEDIREAPMQPFPSNVEIGTKNGAVIAHGSLHTENGSRSIPIRAPLGALKKIPRPDTNDNENGDVPNGKSNGDSNPAAKDENGDVPNLPIPKTRVVRSETRSGAARRSRFFFRPGETFEVGVWEDGNRDSPDSTYASGKLGEFVGRGKLTLGDSVYVDSEAMNFDPFKRVEKVSEWRHEFDRIGQEME